MISFLQQVLHCPVDSLDIFLSEGMLIEPPHAVTSGSIKKHKLTAKKSYQNRNKYLSKLQNRGRNSQKHFPKAW